MYRFLRYRKSCISFIGNSALGANKYLIAHNAATQELLSVATVANRGILIGNALISEMQGCIVWEVNLKISHA
jgi:hypothetical protein